MTEVGLGRVGIVLGLEVSRLARNSTDWHRLLELCALADTLIDPNRRLIHLSTFLGHVDPTSTAVYLTITEELLREADRRFRAFAPKGGDR